MDAHLFGRTNHAFPPVWYSLGSPAPDDEERLRQTLIAAGAPVDLSANPAYWGGVLRSTPELPVMQQSTRDLERATDSNHAADLVQADLIATLSSIGRQCLDFYFLRSRVAYKEFQLAGAFDALEGAREHGNVRYVGIWAEGSSNATLANWQLHDAFEAVCLDATLDNASLESLARDRRVGVLYRGLKKLDPTKTVLLPIDRGGR